MGYWQYLVPGEFNEIIRVWNQINLEKFTWPNMGPKGGPAAAIPAGMFVLNFEEWSILSATFFIDFNRATDLDILAPK